VDADGYRLPTEAEWEFACRAGSTGAHYGPLAEVAWTSADGVTAPQDVGGKLPNLHGLFDTLGNAWEWCWDLLDPARYDDYRVFRGGGFSDDAWSVRASTRRGGPPRTHHDDVGFRVARGGFEGRDAAQGWSAAVDAERAAIPGPLPPGWTPRR
jgi:formylglycine-generating enzyme required for sulfatase activity